MNRMSKVIISVILVFVSLLSLGSALAEDRAALKYYQQGEEYFNASKYDKALDMYRKAVDERPSDGSITIREEKIKMVRRGRSVDKEVSYDVHYEDFFPNRRIAEIEKTLEELAAPCDLVVIGRFQDGNTVQANNSLDPEENGVLLVTVKNSGKGAAFKTNLQISSDNSRIEHDKWVELGDIKPGERIEKRINLRAATNVGDGRAKFTLAFKEKRGKYDVSETAYVPTAKQELPRLVIASAELDDSNTFMPNRILDGGEDAVLIVSLNNAGKGRADNTHIEITSKAKNISFEKSISVGDFKPGETKEIRVPLHANYELEGGKPEFNLIMREERGYDSKSQPVRIMTAQLARPKLEIMPLDIANVEDGNVGLAKGNGNHVIESGETVELIVFIKNSGVGQATGVNLAGSNITAGVNWVSGHDSAIVGTIPPGKTVKAKVAFEVPRNFKANDIRANLKVADSRAIDKAEYIFAQNYSRKSPDLQYEYRIYSKGTLVKQIANGDDYDIELIIKNKGQLAAKNAAVSIRPGKLSDRLMLSRSQMDIGDVKENGTAPTQRFTLSVPRTYAINSAALTLSIVQSDFSGITGELNVPVEIRSPKLRYTTNLVSKNGGSSLEKGEQAALEVQVFNDGGLPAEGVKIALSSPDDNLLILNQKEISIGTIPPGTSSDPVKYQILAKGRLAVGPAKLGVDISQNDEFGSLNKQYALNILEEGATVIDVAGENRPKAAVAASSQAGPKINIKGLENVAPVIEDETYRLAFEVADLKNIANITVLVNGKAVALKEAASLAVKAVKNKQIVQDIPLEEGENRIMITAYNSDNLPSKKEFTITRAAEEDVDTPKLIGNGNPNAFAVVIGISKFKNDLPPVTYARRDAETMAKYLSTTLGYSEKKIQTYYDEQADVTTLKTYFAKLRTKIKPGVSDVFVYYSGHGTPDTNTQEPYFVPYDFDGTAPATTGLSANELYKQLADVGAKSVTIVLDSCFSGKSSDGQQLVKGVSAGLLKSKPPDFDVENGVLLTAATKEQPASWYEKRQHGLFTYYFLQGLQGVADYDKDGVITVEELSAYTRNKVSEQALVLHNREQTPEVKGDGATVVVKYK